LTSVHVDACIAAGHLALTGVGQLTWFSDAGGFFDFGWRHRSGFRFRLWFSRGFRFRLRFGFWFWFRSDFRFWLRFRFWFWFRFRDVFRYLVAYFPTLNNGDITRATAILWLWLWFWL
jgi:hypothetical protein